jgi:hypothetical protein
MRDHRRPLMPTVAVATIWVLSGLVALALVFAAHPPIPDGPILRAVVTTQVPR